MKKEKDLRKSSDSLNWFLFAWGYLEIAESGCDKFLEKDKGDEDKEFLNSTIIISIVFNIKHALEIVIKSFNKTINGNFDKTHNINNLFKSFENKILSKIKDPKDIKETKKDLESLSLIVYHYYELKLFQEHFQKKSDFIIEDPKNTFLRYPENNEQEGVAFVINFYDVIERIKDGEVQEMKEDVEEIKIIMSHLNQMFDKYEVKINN